MCARSMGGVRFLPANGNVHDKPAGLDGRQGSGSMSELATRPVIPRELRPSRVRLDGPGNVAVGPWPIKGATASVEEPGAPDVLAVPPARGGVVSRCALFRRLAEAERVVQMSAPAGSGKTVLMRSWIAEAGLARHAAWAPV